MVEANVRTYEMKLNCERENNEKDKENESLHLGEISAKNAFNRPIFLVKGASEARSFFPIETKFFLIPHLTGDI